MTEENIEVDAEETPEPGADGAGKKKKKKLTFKEQMKELRPLIIILLIAGPAFGAYHFRSMFVGTSFTLEDQFQKETTVDFSGDKPVVMMFLEGGGSKDAMAWGIKLAVSYGDKIENVRVIFLNSGPAARRPGFARAAIQKLTPFPMLIDFDGEVFKRYLCEEGMVNILLVAPNRLMKHRVTGPMNDENWAALAAAIDSLVETE
ncbi:MAG: hypothetical protein IID08_08220 [Candidatus Hydrogenedentes bacterium]|nr:hypothetical protein [Candidatus Hydrogenedentota bacterium]